MLERMDAVSRFASVVLIELISRLDTVYLDNDMFALTTSYAYDSNPGRPISVIIYCVA